MTNTDIYIIISTIIGLITYVILLILSKDNSQRRFISPWLLAVPCCYIIFPLLILGLLGLGLYILCIDIIPNLLFPDKNHDYE
jgi:hypothetical protein